MTVPIDFRYSSLRKGMVPSETHTKYVVCVIIRN